MFRLQFGVGVSPNSTVVESPQADARAPMMLQTHGEKPKQETRENTFQPREYAARAETRDTANRCQTSTC